MSDVETTAVDGATPAATAETTAPPQEQTQEQTQASATEQVDTQDQPRDEKGRFQPRINELTRNWRSAERERDTERAQRERLEQELSQYRAQQPTQAQGVPTLDQYEWDQAKWAQAMTEYVARAAETQAEQRYREQERLRSHQEMASRFEERSRAYAAQNPDYEQALNELSSSVRLQLEVVEAIGISEHGPAVAHYLAQHLDVADRIARLPLHLAAVEVGRIEARVSTPKPKPVTQAPIPGQTLAGGSSPQKGVRSGMSYEEYKAARAGG